MFCIKQRKVRKTLKFFKNKNCYKLGSLTLFSQSQGTSATFVYLASKPEHGRDKVNLCITASPTAYLGGFIERQLGPVLPTVRDILKMANTFVLK